MYDLRPKEEKKKIDWKKYWDPDFSHPFIWKNKWRILLFLFLIIILIFPSAMGQAIGTWINSFFGNIIKYMFNI